VPARPPTAGPARMPAAARPVTPEPGRIRFAARSSPGLSQWRFYGERRGARFAQASCNVHAIA
jgi:hypothetical protein